MVSKKKVVDCYKYIRRKFGVGQIPMKVENLLDIDACLPPQIWSAKHIDCEASTQQLELLMDRIRNEWEEFGRKEPHWSVLTHDRYKQETIDNNIEEFFESGKFVSKIIISFFERHDLSFGNNNTCFELGCGVGRITLHLAQLFSNVIGADISKFHLAVLNEELKKKNVNNVKLLCLDSPFRLEYLKEIDFFCSFIVLQHNPPPVITFLLDTILNKLASGGVAIFQIPTWKKNYGFDLNSYLMNPEPMQMEMHILPQEQVFKIISRNGCRVVEVREDGWADGRTTETISNTFFLIKE